MGDSLARARKHRLLPRACRTSALAPLAAAAVALTLPQPARAIVIRDDTSDSQYIALGAQSQYAPEGFVQVVTSTAGQTTNYNFGSATLIAPDWILTAAHVVSETNGNTTTIFPTSGMYFGQAATMTFPGPNTVINALTESGWNGNVGAGNDLALLQLAVPITNVAPAQLYTGSVNSLLNMTATAVGYGFTGNGLTGFSSTNPADNTRRAMQNVIDTLGGATTNGGPPLNQIYSFSGYSPNIVFTDFDSPNPTVAANENVMGTPTPLTLEGLTAPGDSGGGLFVTTGGSTFLAGVTSFGATFNAPTPVGIYGEVSAFTSVAAASSLNFITSTLQVNATWAASSGGTWASVANWNGQPPEFRGSQANFTAAALTNSTITLDDAWTVGAMDFNNTHSYTLAPGAGGSITLDQSSSIAQIEVDAGSQFISAPIIALSRLNLFATTAGSTLTLSGPISSGQRLTAPGPGTVVLSGANNLASVIVTGGHLTAANAAALGVNSPLSIASINSTAKATLAPNIGAVQVSSLTISSATLDITNNSLAINFPSPSSDPISTILGYLNSGHTISAASTWTGPGIDSSSAAANPNVFSIGYADGNTDPHTAAQPNQVLVKYTLSGDANLDGAVGFADLISVAQHFGFTGQDWADGNFTYASNGAVGFADLILVAQNFGASVGLSASTSPAWALPLTAQLQAVAVVPEPAAVLIVLPLCGLLRRRRRRQLEPGEPEYSQCPRIAFAARKI